MDARRIVVTGVAGAGKTRIGAALAARLALPFVDADDLHPAASRARMAAGHPLTEADRAPWLDALCALIAARPALVLACSALKRAHRDRLRAAAPDLRLLHLHGDFALIRDRLAARRGHFFRGEAMLRSQFADLEPPGPDEGPAVDVAGPPEAVTARCIAALGLGLGPG